MRVGVIGDTHFPFAHPLYLQFVQDTFEQWGVDKGVHIGDVADNHGISFHEHDPNGWSAEDEASACKHEVDDWQQVFANLLVCIGNHDERNFRVAKRIGLPARFLSAYADVWATPNWKWDFSHQIDGVLYEHGTGSSGKDAAINRAVQKRTKLVMGHVHSFAGVKHHANETSCIFGMNVGCGIDCRAYAFDYGKAFPIRPVLGCGIVLDGEHAFFEAMPCGTGQKYNRARAGKKRLRNARGV